MTLHRRLAAFPTVLAGADHRSIASWGAHAQGVSIPPNNLAAPFAHRNGVFSQPVPLEDTGCGTFRRRALAGGDFPATPAAANPVCAAVRRVRRVNTHTDRR